MLQKNQTVTATIDGYSSEGLGIARVEGQVVFVHDAVAGEVCDILILKVLKNAAFGKVVSVRQPSPHRTAPDCPHYRRCGGCAFRHMDFCMLLMLSLVGCAVSKNPNPMIRYGVNTGTALAAPGIAAFCLAGAIVALADSED